MKIQYVVLLIIAKNVCGNTTNEATTEDKVPATEKLKKIAAEELKDDEPIIFMSPDFTQNNHHDFFPEVDYPTSVLETSPFFFKSNDDVAGPFSDDVQSTFKSIKESSKTKVNDSLKNSIVSEANNKSNESSTGGDVYYNETSATVNKNSTVSGKPVEDDTEEYPMYSSNDSGETPKQTDIENAPSNTTEVDSKNFEYQVPAPILLNETQTEEQDD